MNSLQSFAILFETQPWSLLALCFILGLFIGSFLNVVIYRLPVMMKNAWRQECLEFLEPEKEHEKPEKFNLITPNSRCQNCKAPVRAWQNIPVLSYLFLGGKCASCKTKISIRYPLVELATGIISACAAIKFGASWQTLFAMFLCWCLVCLTMIDFDTQLLPDSITLPLLWLGLILNSFNTFTDLNSAVWGAIAGYLSLWSVFWLFKLLTGKEGMGYGDFKLLAALGAWLGWQMLIPIILLSSISGTIVGVILIVTKLNERGQAIAFGPYLAMGGALCLFFGSHILKLLGWI